jgi:hypothetical protein
MSTVQMGSIEPADLSLARAQRRERVRASLAHEHDPQPLATCPAREPLPARNEAWDRRVRLLLGSSARGEAAT